LRLKLPEKLARGEIRSRKKKSLAKARSLADKV
jgi:hypothetical protein